LQSPQRQRIIFVISGVVGADEPDGVITAAHVPSVARSGRTVPARCGPHRATGRTGPCLHRARAASSAHGTICGPFCRATGHSGQITSGHGPARYLSRISCFHKQQIQVFNTNMTNDK
jgi:hypothetical protein